MDNKQNIDNDIINLSENTADNPATDTDTLTASTGNIATDADIPEANADTTITDIVTEGEIIAVSKKKAKRISPAVYIIGGIFATAALFFITMLIVLLIASSPRTVEINGNVTIGSLSDSKFLSEFCSCETNLSSLDTSCISDIKVNLKFFGFIPKAMTIKVRDTIPPEFTVCNVNVMMNMEVSLEDFVTSYNDVTKVAFSFRDGNPDLSEIGMRELIIVATDQGNNTSEQKVALTVTDESLEMTAEFGTDATAVSDAVMAAHPEFEELDLSKLDTSKCGEYNISARGEKTYYLFKIKLADTVPPTGTAHSFDLLIGQVLTIDSFVTDVYDLNEVTLSFDKEPDYTVCGEQTFVISATDSAGNITQFNSALHIYNIPASLSIECGIDKSDLEKLLYPNLSESEIRPSFESGFATSSLLPGNHDVKLLGAYSAFTVNIKATDTKAPVITAKDITVYIGKSPAPGDFIASASDATKITYSFASQPSVASAGDFGVTIIASDTSGNKTQANAMMHVITDSKPPVISGVADIYANTGTTISYLAKVTANDNADGNVKVNVDSSGVDASTPGTYKVIYTATDSSGNTATASANVIIRNQTQSKINSYCDNVLSAITNSSMSQRSKAQAIYNWCTGNIKYSTSTSYLMGNYVSAVYSGFTTHRGNCYVYYAVARALLTRAGIENIEIHRNSTSNPHYWNMVKIEGSWYHFDTCPHPRGHALTCFLLTDAQVAAYTQNEVANYYSFDAASYPDTP